MKDFDRFIERFRQFGGLRLVWEYAKMGVLWAGVKEMLGCILHGRSFKSIYPIVTRKVDCALIARYGSGGVSLQWHCKEKDEDNGRQGHCKEEDEDNGRQGHCIWFCWLQGMDDAPELVKACLRSIRHNLTEEVVVLDDRNYTEYVALPDYIVEKYRRGIIPGALFSDMLRLELLIKYGGTWIDATVLCTVYPTTMELWNKIRNSELFIYRYFKNGRVVGMSNWFIHAKPGNALLMEVRDMLYAYWRDYNCTVEYYIFHLFFSIAARRHPEIMRQMPLANSYRAIMLRDRICQPYDEEWWRKLTASVPFHKLNYRKVPRIANGTFYEHIIKGED